MPRKRSNRFRHRRGCRGMVSWYNISNNSSYTVLKLEIKVLTMVTILKLLFLVMEWVMEQNNLHQYLGQ